MIAFLRIRRLLERVTMKEKEKSSKNEISIAPRQVDVRAVIYARYSSDLQRRYAETGAGDSEA